MSGCGSGATHCAALVLSGAGRPSPLLPPGHPARTGLGADSPRGGCGGSGLSPIYDMEASPQVFEVLWAKVGSSRGWSRLFTLACKLGNSWQLAEKTTVW